MKFKLACVPAILAMFFAALVARGSTRSLNAAQPSDSAYVHRIALQGMNELMQGDVAAAQAAFQQVEREDNSSPLGYVLEADALWWNIYYSTADLVDPDVFDVVSSDHTPYDAHFKQSVNTAIRKAEENIRAHRDPARNYLYEGMAYGLKGRLDGLRARDLPTARAGKKMRSLLLMALQLDPKLTDAYTGLGLYNYFVDTLPTIVKMLRFLIGLPGGNRELGLQQMEKAANSGEFTRGEAKFYLAKDYTRRSEMQFSKALALFEQLAASYPRNPFWKLLVGGCQMRLGQRAQGEATYREVLAQSSREKTAAAVAVHAQVVKALEALHPGEKF